MYYKPYWNVSHIKIIETKFIRINLDNQKQFVLGHKIFDCGELERCETDNETNHALKIENILVKAFFEMVINRPKIVAFFTDFDI